MLEGEVRWVYITTAIDLRQAKVWRAGCWCSYRSCCSWRSYRMSTRQLSCYCNKDNVLRSRRECWH